MLDKLISFRLIYQSKFNYVIVQIMKTSLVSFIKSFVIIISVFAIISGATQAAFTSTSTNPGNTFTTGTAELKLLNTLTYGTFDPDTNKFFMTDTECTGVCEDSVPGVTFSNIYPGWTGESLVKVVNTGSLNLILSSVASQTGGSTELSNWITVELYGWNDANSNGVVDPGEQQAAYGTGPVTLTEWFAASPFTDLGQIDGSYEVRGFIFRFAVDPGIPGTFQGSSMSADFTFAGTTVGAVQ